MMATLHDTVHSWLAANAAAMRDHLLLSTIILLALVAASLLPSIRPRTRYALLLLGVAKFLVPGALLAGIAGTVTLHSVDIPSFTIIEANALPAGVSSRSELLCVLGALWIVGSVAFVMSMIASRIQWRRTLQEATSASEREVTAMQRVAGQALRRAPQVLRSLSAIPMTAGLLRGVVLLPESCARDLDDDELTALLAHELTHVERRHNLAGFVQDLAVALFWVNPALWIARRMLEREAEKDCDERVLTFVSDPPTYLSGMLKISHGFIAPEPAGVSCMSTSQLKERMDHLMKHYQSGARSVPHRLATALGIVAVAVTTVIVSAGEPAKGSKASMKDGVTLPKLVTKVNPTYPESARQKRLEGIVIVETQIDKQGNVTVASVAKGIEGAEGQALGDAAVAAVKQWKFEPALKDGKPVDTKFTVTIRFKLDGHKEKEKS